MNTPDTSKIVDKLAFVDEKYKISVDDLIKALVKTNAPSEKITISFSQLIELIKAVKSN